MCLRAHTPSEEFATNKEVVSFPRFLSAQSFLTINIFRRKPVGLQSALSFIDQCDGSIVSAFHRSQYLFVSRFNGGRWCGSHSRVGGVSGSVKDWGDFWGSSFRVCTPYLWLLQMCFHTFFFPRHSPKWLMLMFLFWPFDKRTRIAFFIWGFIILLVKSLGFSFTLSLICPSCKSINFMGYKPCEHSLLTGTNRKVTDPSGGSYWSVTMDYPYHGVVSFKTSLRPCGATGTNPQVLEPLTITFQPFLKGLEKLWLACELWNMDLYPLIDQWGSSNTKSLDPLSHSCWVLVLQIMASQHGGAAVCHLNPSVNVIWA